VEPSEFDSVLRYTLPPHVETPVPVSTLPYGRCSLNFEEAASSNTRTLVADHAGRLDLHITGTGGETARLTVEAETSDAITRPTTARTAVRHLIDSRLATSASAATMAAAAGCHDPSRIGPR
jgi:hypothetical protein